jgi:hypothetical protein
MKDKWKEKIDNILVILIFMFIGTMFSYKLYEIIINKGF